MAETETSGNYNKGDMDSPKSDLETRIEQIIGAELTDARSYIEEEIGPERAESTRYYNGEPFGNEESGRSQVVSRDVSDTIKNYMPSIMRVLFGGEQVVEFKPRRGDAIEMAKQATDYINEVVIQQDNDGFLQVHSGVKDALIRRLGVWKWWWDDRVKIEVSHHTGLEQDGLTALSDDADIEEIEVTQTSDKGIEPRIFEAKVRRRITDGVARFMAVPSDEFLIDRRARSVRDATFVAHRALVTVSDLVAMGYDREDMLDQAGGSNELDTEEALARNPYLDTMSGSSDSENPDMQRVLYVEAWTRVLLDEDSDNPAQLVKACGVWGGHSFKLLFHEEVDEIPFATICPDPEPHTLFGRCPADDVKDVQLIKSAIMRGTLDSLALSIHPRYEAVTDNVNLQDLMNSEVGGVVRVRQPGMLREISLPFVGQHTLPMLGYFDKVIEGRTKQSQASQGLDADALQSSTKAAVSATISAAQANIELVTRIFVETGYRDLFRGLLRLIVRNQDKPRTVRLRGKWVEVNPKDWDAEMDVYVNVALGAGTADEKGMALAGIAQKQEQLMAAMPGNPMVGLRELRNTYAKMVELAGWKDATAFFKEVPEDQPTPPPQDPNAGDAEALMKVQMADIQSKMQMKQMELAAKAEEARMNDERERYKADLDSQVRIAIAEAQTQTNIDEAHINAVVAKMQAQQEAATRMHEAEKAAQAQQAAAQAKAQQQAPTG